MSVLIKELTYRNRFVQIAWSSSSVRPGTTKKPREQLLPRFTRSVASDIWLGINYKMQGTSSSVRRFSVNSPFSVFTY